MASEGMASEGMFTARWPGERHLIRVRWHDIVLQQTQRGGVAWPAA
jgi:hypothetical protein